MKFRNYVHVLARVAALALVISSVGPALAAPPPRPGAPSPEEIEDLRETVQLLMLSRLKRALQLSPDQERVVLPLLDELEQSRQELRQQRRHALRNLRHLLQDDASDDQIAENLRQVRAIRRGFESKRQHIEEEVAAHLSPRQQARLLVFMQEFSRRMRERLERTRHQGGFGRRPGPRGRRDPGMPEEDFWDDELR